MGAIDCYVPRTTTTRMWDTTAERRPAATRQRRGARPRGSGSSSTWERGDVGERGEGETRSTGDLTSLAWGGIKGKYKWGRQIWAVDPEAHYGKALDDWTIR
jgi:hypothetical protein